MRLLTGLLLIAILPGLAISQPLRSAQGWAIYAQTDQASWQALLAGNNLAAGKPVTLQPAPNYAPTTDAQDPRELTDSQLAGAKGQMWTDQRAVGWNYQQYVRIVVDLGKVQPVGQVLVRFQGAINKNNTVPRRLVLALSNDGDYYQTVRTLGEKVNAEDDPAQTFAPLPADKPAIYAFELQAGYRARYVRLDITAHGMVVCDELAVLAGAGHVADLSPAPPGKRDYFDNVFDRRQQFRKLTAPGDLLLGLPLRFAPQPNYRLTTDPNDPTDLTNDQLGQRVDEKIWFEKGAVGWQGAPLVTIFADLQRVQPVASVVVRLLGGGEQGGLVFPDWIRVLASEDGRQYYLVSARHKRGVDDLSPEAWDLPETGTAWVHNFVLPVGLKTRYLAIQVSSQKQFICSDEIAAVKGAATLPPLVPRPDKRVAIVSSGVAFTAVEASLPVCANMPLRTKLRVLDARSGAAYHSPCQLVLDLPAQVRFITTAYPATSVTHQGQPYQRYRVPCTRGRLADFYLQSTDPKGKGVIYTYGDSGAGLENERQVPWEALVIPPVRQPHRLHVSLAWSDYEQLRDTWPNFLAAFKNLGFNCVSVFPRYWPADKVAQYRKNLAEARRAGFKVIVNESPAGALAADRSQPETKSQLPTGPSTHLCPSYRGKYYQKQLQSFAQHAVWCDPDYIFFDIEAYWNGCREAPNCSRCKQRYAAGHFKSWDDFYAAMGREIHQDMKNAIDQARAAAGLTRPIIYGSYRTQPITHLNDGLFDWDNLYPDLLQVAMPSLYVAGNAMAVADNISRNRALMTTNDIIPWLTTGTYGDYDPVHTRDMVLEAFANGARGITYYCYTDFDPAYFKYHAEAINIVAPIEDIFMDGKPLTGLTCDNPAVKLCGMGVGDEMAVLVSNYHGLPPDTQVKVKAPLRVKTQVWDLHTGKKIGEVSPGEAFTVTLGTIRAHMYYLGTKYAAAVRRK